MTKGEKTSAAVNNSEKYRVGRPEYKATDGRTYVLDRKVPSSAPNIKTAAVRNRRDRPSMVDVYRIEHWLSGKGRYAKNYVPAEEKERILSEYELDFSDRMQQYFATEENVWAKLLVKYPDKIQSERLASYSEAAYRAKHRR